MSKTQLKKKEHSSSKTSLPEQKTETVNSSESLGNVGRNRLHIWPEWNDAEVSRETREAAKGAEGRKSSSSVKMPYFEDPEGKLCLPSSLKVHTWRRPVEFIVDKDITVVKNKTDFDMISLNIHLFGCEVIRWIVSEIHIVWMIYTCSTGQNDSWKPWEHIYSMCDVVKGHVPAYNRYGKYLIRLYFMGCWRKITVDDSMPFDEDNNLLLPASTCQSELWPMLLAKALIKVACTNPAFRAGGEMGEFTFVHVLTGWIPVISRIMPEHSKEIWDFLQDTIPKFKHEDERLAVMKADIEHPAGGTDLHLNDNKSLLLETDNKKGALKVAVCASFYPFPQQNSYGLVQTANSSERLRCYGLSMQHSHVVLLTRTRACQLVPTPKPPTVPRWKLIRPRKKTVILSDPQKHTLPKPEQFIEVTSPFLFRSVKSSGDSVAELEAKQSILRQSFHGSPLKMISETEEAVRLEPDVAEPRGTGEEQVKAEDKIKDSDYISSDRPTTAFKEPEAKIDTPVLKTWVDMSDFAKSFQTLLVFHKPQMYTNHIEKSHFKSTVLPKDMGGICGSGSLNQCLSDRFVDVAGAECSEVRGTYYLYIDSLHPSEIVISLSALLLWGDIAPSSEKQLSGLHRSAVLLIQPHSWTSLQSKCPVLTIKTTYSKADILRLPAGRHVFCIHVRGTLGYHLHLCCKTQFILGDEETIMLYAARESARFTEQALSIFKALSSVVASFADEQKLPRLKKVLEETFPTWKHQKVFNSAVHRMVCEVLGRKLTPEEHFALKALTNDPSILVSDGEVSQSACRSHFYVCKYIDSNPSEILKDSVPTDTQTHAAIILQAGFKGHLVRRVLNASKPGTKENLSASKILSDMWPKIESEADKHAAFLLRYIITNSRKTEELHPCLQDESTRITFADYSVPFQETTHSWVLVFREVFIVPEEMLLVPKVFTPVPNCCLLVVNNDTGEEVGMLKVVPHVYKPNKLGYTFVADVIKPDIPVIDAKWRMRLIGSKKTLPKLSREIPVNLFSVNEFQDYYIPNNKHLICRYCVQVTTDMLGTIQFETSDPRVLIRLSILDKEKEVAGKTGKGFVLLPAFFFLVHKGQHSLEPGCDEENKQRMTFHHDIPHKKEGTNSTTVRSDLSSDQTQDHKYVVQAEVLCSSWSLDESQMVFVQMLQEMKKNEMRVFKQEDLTSSSTISTSSYKGNKAETHKTTQKGQVVKQKGKTAGDPRAVNKQEEMTLDLTKPNWTLRVVTDQTDTKSFEGKKDTERADQIRSIKKAWETTEPGRFEKALQSRLKFLNQVQQKKANDATTEESKDIAPFNSDPDVHVSQSNGKMSLPPYSHLIRKRKDFPELMDSEREEARQKQRFEKIQKYQLAREKVLEHYKQQVSEQKALMKHHLEVYDNMLEASQKLCKDYKTIRSHLTMLPKMKSKKKPAVEKAEQAVPEKTITVPADANPPKKHAKRSDKK